jgi:hypothetical protein
MQLLLFGVGQGEPAVKHLLWGEQLYHEVCNTAYESAADPLSAVNPLKVCIIK